MSLSDYKFAGLLAVLTMGCGLTVSGVGATQVTAAAITTTPAAQKSVTPTRRSTPPAARKPIARRSTKTAARKTAPRTTASTKRARTTAARTAASKVTSKGVKAKARTAQQRGPLTGRQRLARLHLEPERVREIQEALGREGYLQGVASGQWDDRTRSAMLHYQTDHGFPATGLPEAKSLMKLGLGSHPLPASLDRGIARASTPDAPKAVTGADPSLPSVTPEAPSRPQE